MWDRKRTDAPPAPATPQQPQQQPQSAQVLRPAAPVSPVRAPEPVKGATEIGKSISIIGDIYSEEDLFIDGEVQGALEVKDSKLTVGPNGKAKSNVKAREVVILGEVHGDIDASHKITIRKQGSLVGNIRTMGIVIDDDAYFKGSIDIVRKNGDGAAA
jgi:cytoskeletal protein CcmA (bactofilin family)